jgi:hypothetical protein
MGSSEVDHTCNQEAGIKKIEAGGQPRQKVSETPSQINPLGMVVHVRGPRRPQVRGFWSEANPRQKKKAKERKNVTRAPT